MQAYGKEVKNMIVKIIFILLSYNVIVDCISYFAYLFCRKKKTKKECWNLLCKYGKTCKFNTLYNHNEAKKGE